MDQHGVAERRHTRRLRPRGVCGYRPRHRPDTQQPSELDEFLRDSPGTAAALRQVQQLSDEELARFEEAAQGLSEELRREIPDPDPQEAAEIVRLHERSAGMRGAENAGISCAETERFETSRYRHYATLRVFWIATRIESGRRRERRDPLYLGPHRYGQMSKRFSRRWGHLRPSQINRHSGARRDIARELYGCAASQHRRAPGRKPIRRPGSRRTTAPTRGDPDEGDPEPPAPAPGAERRHTGGTSDHLDAAHRRLTREGRAVR